MPIPVAANRGGTLRSAELLHILTALSPVSAEEAATTPLFRYAKELVEMSAKEKKYHTWISHDRVMRWYRDRARAAGVQHVDLIKMHSFRIGGATAMMAAGISAEEIKTRGRWASDVYQIYCRVCEGRLLEISKAMSNVRTDSFIGRGDSFFSFAAGANKDLPADVDTEAAGTMDEQANEDELMSEACSDDEEMGEFGGIVHGTGPSWSASTSQYRPICTHPCSCLQRALLRGRLGHARRASTSGARGIVRAGATSRRHSVLLIQRRFGDARDVSQRHATTRRPR